jgi:hypothetical protein
MGETNSPLVAHVGYDISPLLRVKFNSLEWKNIVTHGQLKENLYILFGIPIFYCECILWKVLISTMISNFIWRGYLTVYCDKQFHFEKYKDCKLLIRT